MTYVKYVLWIRIVIYDLFIYLLTFFLEGRLNKEPYVLVTASLSTKSVYRGIVHFLLQSMYVCR